VADETKIFRGDSGEEYWGWQFLVGAPLVDRAFPGFMNSETGGLKTAATESATPRLGAEMLRFAFWVAGCTLQAFSGYSMGSRTKRSNVHTSKANARGVQQTAANPRATFKLFGQAPMQATILSRNRGGFWIQGGKLAEYLGGCDYSGVEVDVCFLSANKVEWYKVASASAETGQ
jgi:hypothetical protein